MGEAAASLKQSGDVLAANHKALVGGISKDIDRTYNAFFKSTNEVVERMGWVIEDVKNTIARLPDTVDGAADLYARQADRLTDALRRAQDALDESVDRLTRPCTPTDRRQLCAIRPGEAKPLSPPRGRASFWLCFSQT